MNYHYVYPTGQQECQPRGGRGICGVVRSGDAEEQRHSVLGRCRAALEIPLEWIPKLGGLEDTFWSHRYGQQVGERAVPTSSTYLSHQFGVGRVLRDAPNV